MKEELSFSENPKISDFNAKLSFARILKFLIPSAIGILLFLVPFKLNGKVTLLLNVIIDWTTSLLGSALIPFVLLILGISAVCSVIGVIRPNTFQGFLKTLFVTNMFIVLVRIAAAVLAVLVYFEMGLEIIWSADTGGLMLHELLTILVPFFLWAGLTLPLLSEFGLMEFVGVLARPILRPLFKIPGRSAVNCVISWFGSGSMGVILTDQEYKKGFYTEREAIRIATGFSVVSVPAAALFNGILGIPHLFPLVYGSLIITGIIVNVIIFRIPPISKKSNEYIDSASQNERDEKIPEHIGMFKWAVVSAVNRANEKKGNLMKRGLKITADIWFTVLPNVMAIGTAATIIAMYTPFFQWISYPFVHVLNFMGLPDAVTAAPVILLGFVDIFLPFILGEGIASVKTKFVISVLALSQIIFMTEVGPLLLKTAMKIKWIDLVSIFMLRTLIALPIAACLAHLFAYLQLL